MPPNKQNGVVLRVEHLRTYFALRSGLSRAVDDVSFDIGEGETVALVGESGCGKSVTGLSLTRLVPPPAVYAGGRVVFRGRDVLTMDEGELRDLRGRRIAYVFQDPAESLNPVMTVGYQIEEAIRLHLPEADPKAEALKWLKRVGLSDPAVQYRAYPHQLSGGMQQRAMIAMALACHPELLVADEPTTALDVTIQAQIMDLLVKLQREVGMALLLITHNLGIVAGVAHRLYVMYAGRIVESGPVEEVLEAPAHPYTRGLLAAVPSLEEAGRALTGIEGTVPNPMHLPPGCAFHPRCPFCRDRCRKEEPTLEPHGEGRAVRCHFWREL